MPQRDNCATMRVPAGGPLEPPPSGPGCIHLAGLSSFRTAGCSVKGSLILG